jgi:DNA (cytosine-5)-methyltransferase 1
MIGSIWATRGTAAHHFVSIIDAIGDLPPFDWKYPGPEKEPGEFEKVAAQRRTLKIPRFECHDKSVKCGFTGTAKYPKKPRTRFQLFSREISTEDIQHFTANFDERRVKQ